MTPKQEFQAHAAFTRFASMLNSQDLEYALRTAELTFTDNMPESIEDAGPNYYQLVGVKKFIRTLRGLAELPTERKPNNIGQLNQNV